MENTEKYYDIVVELVKNHKKYIGCEEILDDIVNDVLEHSKVVLSSVTNDAVVDAYLNKVVSTSIITVPRRLNINKRPKSNIVEILELSKNREQTSVIVEEECLDSFIDESDNYEVVEKEVATESDVITEEESIVDNSAEIINEDLVITEENSLVDVENNIEDIISSVDSEDLSNNLESEVICEQGLNEHSDVVDMSLVEKMINGVSIQDDIVEEEVITDDCNENVILNEKGLELEEDISVLEDFSVEKDSEENALEELTELDNEDLEDDLVNNVSCVETCAETLEIEDSAIEDIVEIESSGIEESLEILEESIDPITDIKEENTLTIYNKFNFEPEEFSYEYGDEVKESLINLDTKKPHLKVIQVCNLKYTEGKTVSEISELLEIGEDSVLESLSEIIDLVKD